MPHLFLSNITEEQLKSLVQIHHKCFNSSVTHVEAEQGGNREEHMHVTDINFPATAITQLEITWKKLLLGTNHVRF